jgi:DNA-directed RNA polymerase subunit M/transcription elongation factor TFIIS
MAKPKFYQAALLALDDDQVKANLKGSSMSERMGSEDAECPECEHNTWWLLPKESAEVREGGKLYCECLHCGYTTHM